MPRFDGDFLFCWTAMVTPKNFPNSNTARLKDSHWPDSQGAQSRYSCNCSTPSVLWAARASTLQRFERRKRVRLAGFTVRLALLLTGFFVIFGAADARDEALVHLRTHVMLRHERKRKQQLLFDQVDEIELARAHDHIDFIVVEREFLRFLFGGHQPVNGIDIERLLIRRETALTFET